MLTLRRAYRFHMRPNREQERALARQAGARRWAWNWALARRRAYFAEHGKTIPAAQLSAELTALKGRPETAWLKEADSQALQQALKDLDRAFVNFFEGCARFPRFKSCKRDEPRFRIPQRVKIADGKVYVPKVGWVRVRQSQPVDAPVRSATFKRAASGRWFVTLTVAFTVPDVALPAPDPAKVAGVDLGLEDFAVLSTGPDTPKERVPAPKFFRKAQGKLRRAQRVLSRRRRGSKRRLRARRRVARIHQRVADRRGDFLHKLTTGLVGRFDGLCIEDLCVRGLARTKLAKSVLDAAHGEFRRQVGYKAVWRRKHLAVVDRFYPSSRTCHACGRVNDALTLADRSWVCVCGAVHDRDSNASDNIRDEGLRILAVGHTDKENAQGAGVSPHQAAVGDELRIPRL
jgi:putative transposase